MKATEVITKRFYLSLGGLFYAIAAVDKLVQPSEILKLREIVRDKWVPIEDAVDEFGTDEAYQIEVNFDWLLEEDQKSEACFKRFVEFKRNHEWLFDEAMKQLIWQTADSIASTFTLKNKSELVLLSKLRSVLKESSLV
jgi:hypothetical protein